MDAIMRKTQVYFGMHVCAYVDLNFKKANLQGFGGGNAVIGVVL
jgi:hypothetical protein